MIEAFTRTQVLADGAAEIDKPLLRYEEPKYMTGSIFSDAESKQLLFNFTRTATRSGSTLHVTRDFTTPDGKPAARESIVYDGNSLESFDLEEFQTGVKASANVHKAPRNPSKIRIDVSYAKPGSSAEHGECTEAPDATLVNDMVAPFFLSHWDELLNGAKIKCRFLVLERKETLGFAFSRDSESTWQGRPVVILKMAPSSPIVATLVEPLFFTVEKASPHRVLQYVGRTTPKVLVRDKWKAIDAVTVFNWPSSGATSR